MMGQRVIFMEGPDRTLKSTIGQGLSFKLDIPYFKVSSEAKNWKSGTFKEAARYDQTYILEFLKQTGYDVIIDRGYASEWVYSKVFGRDTDEDLLLWLDREFAKLGTMILITGCSDYSKASEDAFVPREKLQEIHDMYAKFREWTHCNTRVMLVDTFQWNMKNIVNHITEVEKLCI